MSLNAADISLNALQISDVIIRGLRSVRFANSFPQDFEACHTRLDTICWKLEQWAQQYLDFFKDDNHQIPDDARDVLEMIKKALKEADYPTIQDVESAHEDEIAPIPVNNIREFCDAAQKLHNVIEQHVQKATLFARAKDSLLWVIYRHEEYDRLLISASVKVERLFDMFPGDRNQLKEDRKSHAEGVRSNDEHMNLSQLGEPLKEAQLPSTINIDKYILDETNNIHAHYGRVVARGAGPTNVSQHFKVKQCNDLNPHFGATFND